MDVGLVEALIITVVGMALVFVAILLVAGLTGLLVRLTSGRETLDAQVTPESVAEHELKLRAATAAVAVALAQQVNCEDTQPQPFPLPPTALVSTWQAVQRANLMGQRRTVR
jgi:Na+-transporting methylmalonyl-CoA/oxaloacetate decarboxylase gamma subunit